MVAAIDTQTISFPGAGVTLTGFLARPSTEQPGPALILLHEWWGLNERVKEVATRFAQEGFVALAVDCYARLGHKATTDPAEAAKMMESLNSQQILTDLNATTRYLKQQPFVDAWKLAAVGFSMGGTFALMMADHNSDLKASVSFYGQVPPTDSLKYLLCPVLFIHGALDTWVTKREADRLAEGLKQHQKPGQVVSYPNCPHSFFNHARPEVYRSAEAADAWQRTLTFLRQHLST